jgi:aminoglycoside phosphotransferase (APT) family kinase protein
MVLGAPNQSRWTKNRPRLSLPRVAFQEILALAFPQCNLLSVSPLSGLRNSSFKLELDRRPCCVVLRVYEHDVSICRKEIDLLERIAATLPVPEILYAEPDGLGEIPPFVLTRYIEGVTLQHLKRSGDGREIAQAAFAVGEVLAEVGRVSFERAGWLGPGADSCGPLMVGNDPIPSFVDACLAEPLLQNRVSRETRDSMQSLVWSYAPRLIEVDAATSLVHGDFGKRNVLMKCEYGQWRVAGILDWEFAVSGSPLIDIGHFLRYERAKRPLLEPWFGNGFVQAGGGCRAIGEGLPASSIRSLCSQACPAMSSQTKLQQN